MALQRAMGERNAGQPEERRVELRIGIARGDVTVRGYDVSGSGFNLAIGLEALGPPGGICVSGEVYDDTVESLHLEYEELGPQSMKNNAEGARAYRASEVIPA